MVAAIGEDMPVKPWKEIAAAKKAEQASRIPVQWILSKDSHPAEDTVDLRPVVLSCGILSERELKITGETYDATSLAASIAEGVYSAEEVVTAFCKRAAIGQQLLNNLTEIMFTDAIENAKKLDAHFQQTGKTVGPLHGLPMTFKECFHVKGYDACNGYISRTFDPSITTTYAIEVLQKAGACLISKTNTPQTMLAAETENNVFGQTKNPVVSHLTCGGSSGGEGSNMAFRGAAFGMGTDVGGSIRIPAAANGVYGYKPSSGILPFIGYAASGHTGTNTGIPAVLGPITNSARDLALVAGVLRSAKPWNVDPAVIPGIFEREILKRTPVVGVIHSSGIIPHPPVQRALREAVAKLTAAGYEVKEFTPPDFRRIRDVTQELFTLDGMSYQRRELAKAREPVVACVDKIGFWHAPRKTHEEAWAWNTKKLGLQKEMLDAWKEAGIDLVICPAGAHSAVLPSDWTLDHYTVAWNAMDYPAITIPFTTVDPARDPKDIDFVPEDDLNKNNEALYDLNLLAGAPVGIQVVGSKYSDAQLLHDTELIVAALNGVK